jgi:hypothetical protein
MPDYLRIEDRDRLLASPPVIGTGETGEQAFDVF